MPNRRSDKTDLALWLIGGLAIGATPLLIRRKVRPQVQPNVPVADVRFANGDGVRLAADLYAGAREALVIVVHGFTSSKNAPVMVETAEAVSRDFDVLALDLRGHGQSQGVYDMSADAVTRDVISAVEFARSLRYRKIALVGFSLGAASAVMAAAELGDVDAVVSVACPAAPLTGKRWNATAVPLWQGWARLMGTRVTSGGRWDHFPVDVVDRVRAPVLIIHCGDDALIPLDISERFFDAAVAPKEFLCLPGIPHAELGPEGLEHVRAWLSEILRPAPSG